jgi:hypothetical protein
VGEREAVSLCCPQWSRKRVEPWLLNWTVSRVKAKWPGVIVPDYAAFCLSCRVWRTERASIAPP